MPRKVVLALPARPEFSKKDAFVVLCATQASFTTTIRG